MSLEREVKKHKGVIALALLFLLGLMAQASLADSVILNESNLGNIGDTYVYEDALGYG
jgi:hypothetical protein